jgi:hypothetical protein
MLNMLSYTSDSGVSAGTPCSSATSSKYSSSSSGPIVWRNSTAASAFCAKNAPDIHGPWLQLKTTSIFRTTPEWLAPHVGTICQHAPPQCARQLRAAARAPQARLLDRGLAVVPVTVQRVAEQGHAQSPVVHEVLKHLALRALLVSPHDQDRVVRDERPRRCGHNWRNNGAGREHFQAKAKRHVQGVVQRADDVWACA